MVKDLPVISKKKVIQIGNAFYVAIPKEWLQQHNIQKGEEIVLVANEKIHITPFNEEIVDELHKKLES